MEDIDRIRLEIEIGQRLDEIANANLREFSNDYRIFDTLAAYAGGDISKKFSSHRILVRVLGRRLAFLTLNMAAPLSNQHWRILIRERLKIERPDRGTTLRKLEIEDGIEQIGVAFHMFRKEGLSKSDAIKRVRLELKLNLSESSIRQKLLIFSRLAQHRGYVNRLDPILMRMTGGVRQPKLLVKDITRRGRPKKVR